jgi:hypothetical protein
LEESINKFKQDFLNHAAEVISQVRDQQFDGKQGNSKATTFDRSFTNSVPNVDEY